MITSTNNIAALEPVFREYLSYMSRFFDISDYNSWCDNAVKNLRLYTEEDGRHIFICTENGDITGFAFINGHLRFNDSGFAVAEFYIREPYRCQGLGRKLAEYLFDNFRGEWEVAVTEKNHQAYGFWKTVVSSYTAGHFEEKTGACPGKTGFSFNNALIV